MLITETGAGLSNADSFASVSDCDSHNTNYINSSLWDAADTTAKEKALRVATRYIELRWAGLWKGDKKTLEQALAFPRTGLYVDSFLVSDAIVPTNIVLATCEAAVISLSEDLLLGNDSNSVIIEESVQVGPIKEKLVYASGKTITKSYPVVDGYLWNYVKSGGTLDRS